MKKYLVALVALLLPLSMVAGGKTPAAKLIKRMEKLQKRGVMVGHQDDSVYGTSWHYDRNRSDVKEVCGDYPAVMGFDLGKIELQSDKNLDGVPFDRMREEIASQHQRGGIITLSWHPWNPVTGENAWDPNGDAVAKILPGGSLNSKFCAWLDAVSGFIASLKDAKGKAIPVIFRPWHEMSGGWFWWGSKSCTPQQYQHLYQYTHQYVSAKCPGQVMWAYSPNLADGEETVDSYLKYYPGDAYVDLIGIDVYQFSTDNGVYQANLRKELDAVLAASKQQHKLMALTETGYQNVPDANWFTQCLLPVVKEYPICYVLLWRNAWDKPEENYIAAPGKPTVADFLRFYQDKTTLFLNDIK